MDYIYVRQQTTDNGQQILSVNDVKELLKDWIKLYPNSFAPDVEFRIYQHEDDIIIRLHEDMSSLAVALLVLYFDNRQQTTDNGQQSLTTAYVTIDDTEVLLKQNVGKRAMIVGSQQTTDNSLRLLLLGLYSMIIIAWIMISRKELSLLKTPMSLSKKKK